MGVQILGGASGSAAEVGAASQLGLHATVKPVPAGVLGHYRVNHRAAIIALQAANSRLFEVQNGSTNLIVPTRLVMKVIQTGAFTAAIEDSFDVFKCTGFTAVDTTSTTTPTASRKRTSMSPPPGAANIRGVTSTGVAAGMTSGTLVKDGGTIGQLFAWFLAAAPTAGQSVYTFVDNFDDVNGTNPLVLAQNEGFIVENRVLLGAAAAATIYFDLAWAEVTAY